MLMKHDRELLELILNELVDVRRTLVNCNKIEKLTGTITTTINYGSNVIELYNVILDKTYILPSLFECRYYIAKSSWYYFHISDKTVIEFHRYISDGYDFDNSVTNEIVYQDGEWLC